MSHLMNPDALKKCGATNRNENYPTPVSLIRKMVKQSLAITFTQEKSKYLPIVRVLDLCAGNAAWGIVAKQELEKLGIKVHLTAIEIDDTIQPAPEVDEWIQADFCEIENLEPFDFIFSNPPFSLVYEITAWVRSHLLPWGVFTLLIGSNFMFAETYINTHLKEWRPILEIKWTKRPSFIQLFSKKAYGKEVRKTNAKDYCGYYFAGTELNAWLERRMEYPVYLNIQSDTCPWVTVDAHWDYAEDLLEAILVERPVTVQQALIREAAEAEKEKPVFDDYWSLMAANVFGWDFYYADPEARLELREQVRKEYLEEQLWEGVEINESN